MCVNWSCKEMLCFHCILKLVRISERLFISLLFLLDWYKTEWSYRYQSWDFTGQDNKARASNNLKCSSLFYLVHIILLTGVPLLFWLIANLSPQLFYCLLGSFFNGGVLTISLFILLYKMMIHISICTIFLYLVVMQVFAAHVLFLFAFISKLQRVELSRPLQQIASCPAI